MKPQVEAWLSLTSPYSYLAAPAISALLRDTGAHVTWRVVNMAAVFRARGWQVNPFVDHPEKLEYMFRDVQREARARNIPFRRPVRFPQDSTLVTSIASAADAEGALAEYCRSIYTANYVERRDVEDPAVIERILAAAFDAATAARWLGLYHNGELLNDMQRTQERAIAKGIFGVPTFFVGREMFWGGDRIERVIDYLASGQRTADIA